MYQSMKKGYAYCMRNLSDVAQIPFYVKFILYMGLNFTHIINPTRLFINKINENLRLFSWNVHYKLDGNTSTLTDLDKLLIDCKMRTKTSTNISKLQNVIVPNPQFSSILVFIVPCHDTSKNFPPPELIKKNKIF